LDLSGISHEKAHRAYASGYRSNPLQSCPPPNQLIIESLEAGRSETIGRLTKWNRNQGSDQKTAAASSFEKQHLPHEMGEVDPTLSVYEENGARIGHQHNVAPDARTLSTGGKRTEVWLFIQMASGAERSQEP